MTGTITPVGHGLGSGWSSPVGRHHLVGISVLKLLCVESSIVVGGKKQNDLLSYHVSHRTRHECFTFFPVFHPLILEGVCKKKIRISV